MNQTNTAPKVESLEIHEPGGPTGPVIFAHSTARAQLLATGSVLTFRKNARTVGETHARWERTGKAKLDVTVEYITTLDPRNLDELRPHSDESGFVRVDSWQRAIGSLNGSLPESGHLYRVTLDGLRVQPKPTYTHSVGTHSTHETRHEAAGVAAILNGRRRRCTFEPDIQFTPSHYPVCQCEYDHTSPKYPTCQLCGGVRKGLINE